MSAWKASLLRRIMQYRHPSLALDLVRYLRALSLLELHKLALFSEGVTATSGGEGWFFP